ncbi:MAG: HEAT repeat domain-containing protein [Spirochaetia bacterium]|nr:HEAT repeat domain-containing protein [Spirochaetia bacterium]
MKRVIFVIFILTVSAFFVFPQSGTQSGTQGGEKTVEEKYLSTSIEIGIISELAAADTREQKLVALDTIEKMVNDGKVREGDVQLHSILTSLSGEGTSIIVRESNRNTNYYPEVRRRAAKLLGEIGGENSKDSLINIALKDVEPMVLSQAVYGLGVIGLNNNNEALLAIAAVIDEDSKKYIVDDNLAVASLLAIEKIARKNGGFEDEPDPKFIYKSIVAIQQGNYSPNVKKWAGLLIDKLRQY